jgi:hypothetical protein
VVEATWRAVETFDTANRRIKPTFVLADADGTLAVDADGDTVGGLVKLVISRDEVLGPKPFDALALLEFVEVNYADLSTTIANGASLSSAVPLSRRPVLWFTIPNGWDDAVLTFQVSTDGITFYELLTEAGAAVSLTVSAGTATRTTNLDQWAGFNYLKIRSGTSGTPVNQSGAVTILLTVRDA